MKRNYPIRPILLLLLTGIIKPQRSPLRLRFYTCTLESTSYVIGIVIYETLY